MREETPPTSVTSVTGANIALDGTAQACGTARLTGYTLGIDPAKRFSKIAGNRNLLRVNPLTHRGAHLM
jgi:hypothetical protein